MLTAGKDITGNPMGIKYHLKYYPNSIVDKYYKKETKPNNFDLIFDIVKNYKLDKLPTIEDVIVHLRIGDVIEYSRFSVDEHLEDYMDYNTTNFGTYGGLGNYVKPYKYYKDIIDKYKLPKNIIIKAGGCVCDKNIKGKEYVEKIKKFFENNGFKVEYDEKNNLNPDDDFVYMCNAKYFIKSGGGFSRLIGQMVEKNSCTVCTI